VGVCDGFDEGMAVSSSSAFSTPEESGDGGVTIPNAPPVCSRMPLASSEEDRYGVAEAAVSPTAAEVMLVVGGSEIPVAAKVPEVSSSLGASSQ
jgi:hypothetical protein